jgi:phosphohistidine phosphatase
MPSLVLLRHAKSAYPAGVADHDRPLNGRGRRDAPVAGRMIADLVRRVDIALVSTATRAQQTWAAAGQQLEVGRTESVPGLYLASADAMLRRIRALDADSVVVVAHNPGIEILAERLARDTESPNYRAMMAKFPTAAFALLTDDRPLSRWGYGAVDLLAFEVARG